MQNFFYQSIDSTQDEAKRLIDAGIINSYAYITAEKQRKGRGQYGKSWASPAGAGIYLTVVKLIENNSRFTDPEFIKQEVTSTAEKLISTLNEFYKTDYYIEPINDIYYNGRKLAGILIETHKSFIITGIGLNIKNTVREIRESVPAQPKAPPISLEEIYPKELFANFSSQKFIESFLKNFLPI